MKFPIIIWNRIKYQNVCNRKINEMINNKLLFEVYMTVRLLIFITFIIIAGIIVSRLFLKIDLIPSVFSNESKDSLIIFNWIMVFFIVIDEKVRPAYIEFEIIEDEIIIKTYNPHSNKWESPFALFGYKRRIKELKMSREEYNNYWLTIGRFGLKKELKLQKINNDGVYKSSNINISLLGQQKYTNLILAIDRLRSKICLN
jgi:hypothetical protein